MKVENMTSNKGNKIANQFIIYDDDKVYFQSYNTKIAMIQDHYIELDAKYWNYSKTTSKYLNEFFKIFMNISPKEIKANIKDNTFFLTNLN